MRSWSDGYTARKKPAKLDPMAGASLDVREREIRGFRRRNERASLLRRLERIRRKKRRRSLWKRRMRARELLRRRLVDFQMGVRGWFLLKSQHHPPILANITCLPLHRSSRQQLCLDQVPSLQARESHHAQAQRRAKSSHVVIIGALCDHVVSFRMYGALLYDGRARKEVLVQELVLLRRDGIAQRIAQYRIDRLRFTGRR